MRPIQTLFDGYHFRSRTEARYAVMFRALRWRYDFELQGFATYAGPFLPDFWLPDLGVWLEVKPFEPTDYQHQLHAALADETDCYVVAACGTPWSDAEAFIYRPQQNLTGITLVDFFRELGLQREEIIFAFHAAREARFEHGQTPVFPIETPSIPDDVAA